MRAHIVEITAKVVVRSDTDPDQLPADIYSQISEFIRNETDILDLSVELFTLPKISVEQHHIDETRLVTRRSARDQIHLAWNYRCAYCDDPLGRSPTLDHVVPKVHGGLTVRENLISCCLMCNSQKGHKDWIDWYRAQHFWSATAEWAIAQWLAGEI